MAKAAFAALSLLATCGCSATPEQQSPAGDAAVYAGCSVSSLSLPLVEAGVQRRLRATIAEASPNPPAKNDNVWLVELNHADGAPASDAEIAGIETYMPVHDHPGVPAPSAEPAGAAFRLAIHFMMRGPWEVRLDLASQQAGTDRVVFDVCVAE